MHFFFLFIIKGTSFWCFLLNVYHKLLKFSLASTYWILTDNVNVFSVYYVKGFICPGIEIMMRIIFNEKFITIHEIHHFRFVWNSNLNVHQKIITTILYFVRIILNIHAKKKKTLIAICNHIYTTFNTKHAFKKESKCLWQLQCPYEQT